MEFVYLNAVTGALVAAGFLVFGALIFYGAVRRRRFLYRLVGLRMAEKLTSSVSHTRRRVSTILILLAVALALFAALRPTWGTRARKTPRLNREVMFVFDCSRSMLAQDVSRSRLQHGKWLIKQLVEESAPDRFGLAVFAGGAFLECPLTTNKSFLLQSLESVSVKSLSRRGTNLSSGLARALDAFGDEQGGEHRAVVLVSDGGEQQGEARGGIAAYKERNIPIYAIGVGNATEKWPVKLSDGTYLRDEEGNVVRTRLESDVLKLLARRSGGAYVHSTTQRPQVESVVSQIQELVPEKYRQETYREPVERYQLPLLGSVFLLICGLALGDRRSTSARRWLRSWKNALVFLSLGLLGVFELTRGEEVRAASPSGAPGNAPGLSAEVTATADESDRSDVSNLSGEELRRKMARFKDKLDQAGGERQRAALQFNIGRIRHLQDKHDKAVEKYRAALDQFRKSDQVAAAVYQNLGAIYHEQARSIVTKSPEKALKKIDRAEQYYIAAMRRGAGEQVGRNQEQLLLLRSKAERLKEHQQEQRQKDKRSADSENDKEKEARRKDKTQDREDKTDKRDNSRRKKKEEKRNTQREQQKNSGGDAENKGRNEKKDPSGSTKQAEKGAGDLRVDKEQAKALLKRMQERTEDYRKVLKKREQSSQEKVEVEKGW